MRKKEKKQQKQKQKQKQKQHVNVTVQIDNSRKTTQRKPTSKNQISPFYYMQQPPVNYYVPSESLQKSNLFQVGNEVSGQTRLGLQPGQQQPLNNINRDSNILHKIDKLFTHYMSPTASSLAGLQPMNNFSSSMSDAITKETEFNNYEDMQTPKREFNLFQPVLQPSDSLGIAIKKEQMKNMQTPPETSPPASSGVRLQPRAESLVESATPKNIKDLFQQINDDFDESLLNITGETKEPSKVEEDEENVEEDDGNEESEAEPAAKRKEYQHEQYLKRKEERKYATPTDVTKLNLRELQEYANILGIDINNPESGTGRGSKKSKTKKVLQQEIINRRKEKLKEIESQIEPQTEFVYNTVSKGKGTKK